jgi:hypothetical protein
VFAAHLCFLFDISQILNLFAQQEILESTQSAPPQENSRRKWACKKAQRILLNLLNLLSCFEETLANALMSK